MLRTFEDVIGSAEKRNQRWDSDLESELNLHLEEVIRDICRRYPFWFLKVNPGTAFPTTFFPGDEASLQALTPVVGGWLDRGWLRVEPGVSTYKVHSPAALGPTHDADVTNWFSTPLQRFDSCFMFSYEGTQKQDVTVMNSNDSHRAISCLSFGSSGFTQVLWENVLEGDEEVTYLRIHPEPENYYILACTYTLQYSPMWDITTGSKAGQKTSRFIDNYYEAAVASALMFAADFYSDAPLQQFWESRLHGTPNSASIGQSRPQGLVGRMIKDTITMPFKDRMSAALRPTNRNTRLRGSRSRRGGRFGWR